MTFEEMARRLAHEREALAQALQQRDEAREVARELYERVRTPRSGWHIAYPWLAPRVTPPPDTPSAPEDLYPSSLSVLRRRLEDMDERLTASERDFTDCVVGLNEQTGALRERVTRLEDRQGPSEYNLKNIFDRLDTFEYNQECIFERLRALEGA